ncbi:hypothetical protein BpHYR1_018792 [Brachionus plicatilis]|uniref:SWIM-type domain-containing protein n=1 Tax=Brachionus plicatilis TaxID=10195 RepID=A0A3M7PD30_BRAPC|nr:hypothetical protein BpHYR1_018792 [Brachionus plicatilis]
MIDSLSAYRIVNNEKKYYVLLKSSYCSCLYFLEFGICKHFICLCKLLNYYSDDNVDQLNQTKLNIIPQEKADLVGVSRKCVITTKLVAKELPRSGRPRRLTSRDESYIFRKFPNVSVNKDNVRKMLLRKNIQSYNG